MSRLYGPTGLRVACALFAVAALTPLVAGYLTGPPDQRLVDLDVYRMGGESVLLGRPVYGTLTDAPQLLPFTYPPAAALLAVPLAVLPWVAAQWVWVAAVYVPLAATIWLAFRPVLARAAVAAPLVLAGLFVATGYLFPLREQVRFGQVDILLVAMCLADCAVRRPRWPRGALVGLATAVKLVPGVFLVYLWMTGRRKAALTAGATAAVATAVAFLVLPADSFDYWTRAIFDSERLGANLGTSNQSLRGVLLRLFLPGQVPAALWLALLAGVAYAGFRAAAHVSRRGHETAGVAITGLLAVLLSPVAWIHHLAWVVVALGALAGAGRDPRRLGAAAGVWLFFLFTVPWWGAHMLRGGTVPPVLARIVESSYAFAALALIPLLVWAAGREARDTPERVGDAGAAGPARATTTGPAPDPARHAT